MTPDIIIKGKALYTTKGAAWEYGHIGCNFYTGCPHECTYCYLKRGASSKYLGRNKVRLKECFKNEQHAADILLYEMDKHLEACRKHGIFLSFITDPMIEETRRLTVSAIYDAIPRIIPVWVLTKDATFIHDVPIMTALNNIYQDKRSSIHFGFTLTGHDEMEPRASTNDNRIMAMQRMHLMGFPPSPASSLSSCGRLRRGWCASRSRIATTTSSVCAVVLRRPTTTSLRAVPPSSALCGRWKTSARPSI